MGDAQEQTNYEIMVIFDPDLHDEKVEDEIKKLKNFLKKELNTEVTFEHNAGKRELAGGVFRSAKWRFVCQKIKIKQCRYFSWCWGHGR